MEKQKHNVGKSQLVKGGAGGGEIWCHVNFQFLLHQTECTVFENVCKWKKNKVWDKKNVVVVVPPPSEGCQFSLPVICYGTSKETNMHLREYCPMIHLGGHFVCQEMSKKCQIKCDSYEICSLSLWQWCILADEFTQPRMFSNMQFNQSTHIGR